MRADVGAAVALDAARGVPLGDAGSDRALFKGRKAQLDGAVLVTLKGADGETVPLLAVDRLQQLFNDRRFTGAALFWFVFGVKPGIGDFNLHEHRAAVFDRSDVAVNDLVPLREEGFPHGVRHIFLRLLDRDEIDEVEEGRLERDVDVAAEPVLLGDLGGVDDVEIRLFPRELAADVGGNLVFKLLRLPRAVEQQDAALFEFADDVVVLDVGLVMRSDEISPLHEV